MALHVVTDSTSYIPEEMAEGLPLTVVSLSATLGGVTEREVDIDSTSFYRRMRETGEFPTSSQPTVAEIIEAFETPVAAGDEVVGVFISSDMSGTFSTAQMAREQVLERHPEGRIELVDSRSNSMELGFAALAAARAASQGMSIEDAVLAAKHKIDRSRWLFVPATLDYLKMGGRIGTASALLGSLLDIKPVLTVVDGKTAPFMKVRTRARAIAEIAQHFAEDVDEKGLGDVVVHHINDEAAAADLAGRVETAIGRPPRIVPLGPVVGLHVGPGALGVVYWTIKEQHKNSQAAS
jgi:DegV family protein with EDD domain